MKTFWYAIGTFFYSGRFPFAPGTAGSFASLLLLIPFSLILTPAMFAVVQSAGIAFFIAFGIPAATYIEKKESKEDPSIVVIDEAAGQWITFLFVPLQLLAEKPWLWVVGFLLFRLLDILKPVPVSTLEKLPAGLGIMMDDVMAGIYGCICINLLIYFL
ncbi:MAG: phosphatidylglycerophosphatase A [Fibrobacteres bacterium]|nr:phosphatidylglycerophosphatase A [Fibrobacterota bacterium]